MARTIEDRLDTIERLLRDALKVKSKKTWIKVSQLQMITPWQTKDQLKAARENGLVICEKRKDGIFYLLESIPPAFIKTI